MPAAEAEGGRSVPKKDISPEGLEQWATMMRQKFSPPDILNPDGSIKQIYFKPKQVVTVDDKKWGSAEKEALYKGLEQYGVGKWREIGQNLLPKWDDQSIRVKAARLLGSQSLARYLGWKGDKAAVEREYAQNKELGEQLSCWKGGVLVEDDNGSVKKALAERAGGTAQ